MLYHLYSEDLLTIETFISQNITIKKEFLKLLLIYIQRKVITKQQGNEKIFYLFEKLKQVPFENSESIPEFEKTKILKLFSNFEKIQINQSFFLFLNESDLENLLENEWGQLYFMKQLFIFFEQVIFSNEQNSWKRIKLITNILANKLIQNSEAKSWIWKFHQILMVLEEKFILKQHYHHLNQISFYYFLFNDHVGHQRIARVLSKRGFEGQTTKFISDFHRFLHFGTKLQIKQYIEQLKIKKNITNNCKMIYPLFQNLAQLLLNIVTQKKMSQNSMNQLTQFYDRLKKFKKQMPPIFPFILLKIKEIQKTFVLMYSSKEKISSSRKQENKVTTFYKHFILLEVLTILQHSSFRQMQPYFQVYPFCREVPFFFNLQYNLKTKNYSKLNEIIQNMFDFNQFTLEQINFEIIFFFGRWSSSEKQKQQIQTVLTIFYSNFKKNLCAKKLRNLWKFNFKILFMRETMKQKHISNEKPLSCIQYIIEFFALEELSPLDRIHIELFVYLCSFLKGDTFKIDHLLEKFEKKKLIDELRENQFLLSDFLEFVTTSQLLCGEFRFRNTNFYAELLSSEMVNWYFYKAPLFFQDVLIGKVQKDKKQEAIDVLKEFTKYLTLHDETINNIFIYFSAFIEANRYSQLETIFFNFIEKQKLSEVRENNYLSAFLFIVYHSICSHLQNKLEFNQIKRTYVLSILRIDYFPDTQRIRIRNLLKYYFRKYEDKVKPRKKRILDRQDDYAQGKIFLNKKYVFRRIAQKEILQKKINKKVQKLEKNVKASFPEIKDSEFQELK